MYPYRVNNRYSFNTHVPFILGTNINNAKLVAILDYSVAAHYTTPQVFHTSIYPHLPKGTPDNPEKYTYLLFKTDTGENVVYANTWIDENTVRETLSNTVTVVIENASYGDETKIRDILSLSGFKFQITVT